MYVRHLTREQSEQLYQSPDATREVYFDYDGKPYAVGVEGWEETTETRDGDMWCVAVRGRDTDVLFDCPRPCDDLLDAIDCASETLWEWLHDYC